MKYSYKVVITPQPYEYDILADSGEQAIDIAMRVNAHDEVDVLESRAFVECSECGEIYDEALPKVENVCDFCESPLVTENV